MSEGKRPEVLLLDAGNTVVFLDHEALAAAARGVGIDARAEALARAEPIAKRRYEAAVARGLAHEAGWDLHMWSIFEAAGFSPEEARRASVAARREHDSFNLWRSVPEGLPEALARARRNGLRFGIVSNSEGKLDALFERLGLAQHFVHVVDSALEGVRKPDPEIFRRALARFAIGPEQALYAGDIPNIDVDGARGAGIDAVLIDPFDHYPEYTSAPRYASVVALLAQLGV